MQSFKFNTTASLVFESGAAGRLAEIVGMRLGRSILIVTDPGIRRLGLCDDAVASLRAAGHIVMIYDQTEANP
ncbi:iron-containing alcohol dehydrogenase, partial [Rhizobium ruizarguesonis]